MFPIIPCFFTFTNPNPPGKTPGIFLARKSIGPKKFREIATKTGKQPGFPHFTDRGQEPGYIPAQLIEPATLALKFQPPVFFGLKTPGRKKCWFEILKTEKFSG
jgi:hypothetical protein